MRKEQNVEKLFRDTFSNFEAEVNPSVWTNIEQHLPAQNIPGNAPAAKPSGFFAKVGLNTIVLVAALSAALIGTTIYLSSSQKPEVKDVLVENTEPQPNNIKVSLTNPPPVDEAPVAEPKHTPAHKQTESKAKEKVTVTKPSAPAVFKAKTESTANVNSVQVSKVENTITAPAAPHKNTQTTTTKVSSPAVVQGSEQESPKVLTPPTVETSPVSAGPLNSAAHGEQLSPAEYVEEFHFYIPNVFTPNGDLINDYFTPIGNNSNIKDYELTIYDRYGFEIFKSQDISNSWDGKLKDGTMASQAVYVYTIKLTDFKGEAHDYMGYVALLK